MLNINTIATVALIGILPAFLWLMFWLREDEHPEPRLVILTTFFFGMLCVPLVLPFQYIVSKLLANSKEVTEVANYNLLLAGSIVGLWAFSEEFFKYIASHLITFQRKALDEPMDWVIYMISTALGFAAAENILFIISPMLEGDITKVLATGNLRFIGATLLHVISSSIIGAFMAFAFYKSNKIKIIYRTIGIFTATALHTAFNLFIIVNEHSTIIVFSFVWIAIIALILLIEKIKRLQPDPLEAQIN